MNNGIHFRPTRADISMAALQHNAAIARRHANNCKLLGVIKADAYGHGAIEVARAIQGSVDAFAVAFIDEALTLRQAGFTQPIVLLEGCFSEAELPVCAHYNLQPVVHHQQQLDAILQARLVKPVAVWLKADTGMHRLGFPPTQVAKAKQQLDACKQVASVTLMTHYANADKAHHQLNELQQQRFTEACAETSPTAALSSANTAALLSSAIDLGTEHNQWCRTGILLYGVNPTEQAETETLQAAMRLTAPVMAIRDIETGASVGYGSRWQAQRPSRIATLAIGYADGYPRHAPDGTPVWIQGQKAPLVGLVSMDMITVDVTDCERIEIGMEAELWGPNLPVSEVAKAVGTISYELLSRVSPRVPRHYK
ncbi:Alanine racemase, catabolic [Pseudidiomarina piscicola]|uniref:Alanine racemase n=1 Tax=Pseudidiomarina piscicola TaxID=2614830 RepID=A0A6S6WJB1_9GAMM|nr:alanine racemase [Pseudidiomarina piscicola]CAB0150711.1 Alanine racemase, catabolic [Pseudidiomarina piscicola]VZT40217.1 Alanine racemase, catabolic [Pseudomonas aeruginosa]